MCPVLCWILGNTTVHNVAPVNEIYTVSGNWALAQIITYHAGFLYPYMLSHRNPEKGGIQEGWDSPEEPTHT